MAPTTRISGSRGGGKGMVSIDWDNPLPQNIRTGGMVFLQVLEFELDAVAAAMESFAKSNHPWQNQTGDAERTFSVRRISGRVIEAKHGVHYGKWLEWKYGGRDGVIPATMDYGKGRLNGAYAKAWVAAWRFS